MLKKYIVGIILLANTISLSQAQTAFIGEKIIGPEPSDYLTIGEAVNALKLGVVAGPTVFKIKPGLYEEQIKIPFINGTSTVNTITFESQSGNASDVIIKAEGTTGTSSYVISLFGTRFIIIKKLTIVNTGKNIATGILISATNSSFSSGENNRIEGCIVKMDTTTVGKVFGISISNEDINSSFAGTICSYNTINNNTVIGGVEGINIIGNLFSTRNDNIISSNNISKVYSYGIHCDYGLNNTITKNTISLRKSTTLRGRAAGLYIVNESQSLFANNFIIGNFENISTGGGIYIDRPLAGARIYHNSVNCNITGATTGAIYINPYESVDIANNVFSNTAGGRALYLEGTTAFENTINTDYNNFYTTGPELAFYHRAHANLSAYQTESKKDSNSISVFPAFNSANDLHTFNPNMNNKGKSQVDVSDDIDGETRSTSVPDIGADEYTALLYNISMESVNTVDPLSKEQQNTVKIVFRNDGVNSLKDSIVFVSYSTDEGQTWSPAEQFKATGLTTPYSTETFTFAKKWTVDKIKTYNLMARINSPGLRSDTKKINETASINLCLKLNGTITVGGTTPDFPTITEAVQVLSCGGINGPLIINIRPGTYNERFAINPITGTSTTNTITLRSESGNANDVIISAVGGGITTDHHVVQINGADFVTLENLSIENTFVGNYASGIHVTNTADNLSIKGCILKIDTALNDNIYRLGITVSSLTDIFGVANNANNLLIENCKFYGGAYGIRLAGTSANHAKNIRINNNDFNFHSYIGIRTFYADITEMLNNTVSLRTNAIRPSYGLLLSYSTSELKLNKNKISNPGINGITLEYISGINNLGLVSNNMVSGAFIDTVDIAGIECFYCDSLNFAYNSIDVNKPKSTAFYFRGTEESGITVINNIFSNSGGGYAIDIDTSAGLILSNYNNLFSAGTILAKVDNIEKADLAEIKALNLIELNSISTNPLFVSPTNLHSFNPAHDGKAIVFNLVTEDIDGQTRDNSSPDIGADEFKAGTDGALINILTPLGALQANVPQSVTVKISNFGTTIISNFPISYTINGAGQVTETFTESIGIGESLNYTFTQAWTPSTEGINSLCIKIEIPADLDPTNDNICRNYDVTKIEGIDGGVSAINSPGTTNAAFIAQTITVEINNYGNTVISNFPVSYKINTGTPVSQNFTESIPVGGSASFSFNTKWTPTEPGTYTVCVETAISADINPANNPKCNSVTVTQGFEIDGSIVSIISPTGSPKINEPQTITVMIANLSSGDISNVPLSYSINGVNPITETFSGVVPSSGTIKYTFNALWTPSSPGIYTLCSETNILGDVNITNDRKCAEYTAIQVEVGINDIKDADMIELFPNPAGNTLYIKTKNLESAHVSIHNSLGQIIINNFMELSGEASSINISMLENGVYWLSIETPSGHTGKTFLKSFDN